MSRFENPPYYLTAYGLAVKRGFKGTLDQWIASLKGDKGDRGDKVELRYLEDKIQWRWIPDAGAAGEDSGAGNATETECAEDLKWHDLIDVAGIRGDIIEKTLDEANAAAGEAADMAASAGNAATAAQTAQTAAETAVSSAKVSEANVRQFAQEVKTSADAAAASAAAAAAEKGWGFGEDLYTRSVNAVCAQSTLETYEEFCARLDAELGKMPDSTAKLVITRGVQSTSQWNYPGFCVAILTKSSQDAHLITVAPLSNSGTQSTCLWRMHKYGGVWQEEVEWENPPMLTGSEYRTTENYDVFTPVYVKKVNFGALPNNGPKTVGHYCTATKIVRYAGTISEDGSAIPRGHTPFGSVNICPDPQKITVETDADLSSKTAQVQLWYTKT